MMIFLFSICLCSNRVSLEYDVEKIVEKNITICSIIICEHLMQIDVLYIVEKLLSENEYNRTLHKQSFRRDFCRTIMK